jgi:hypothetical protein
MVSHFCCDMESIRITRLMYAHARAHVVVVTDSSRVTNSMTKHSYEWQNALRCYNNRVISFVAKFGLVRFFTRQDRRIGFLLDIQQRARLKATMSFVPRSEPSSPLWFDINPQSGHISSHLCFFVHLDIMSFGFSIGDFIQVSNLAFNLYRQCRQCSKEFIALSNEGELGISCLLSNRRLISIVASLRLVVDDVRVTIKESGLNESRTEEILHLGQGCLDCLIDLEALLRKYQSLGTRSKRTWDRLGWEREKIADIRQRLISNTGLLTSFNTSLARWAFAFAGELYCSLRAAIHQG